MSKAKILDLIKKVLNKSQNNPSEEEASTALLMAQRLALKHGIDMSEVEDFATEQGKTIMQLETNMIGNMPYWHLNLALVIADNFRVRLWRRAERLGNLKKSCIVFFGESRDVEIAKEIYQHALNIIPRMGTRYVEEQYFKLPEGFRDLHKGKSKEAVLRLASSRSYGSVYTVKASYCRGFVAGMNDKFKTQVQTHGMDLMIVPCKEVIDAFEERAAKMKRTPIVSKNIRGNCYEAGRKDGANYELNNKLIGGN